jgi:hypothetical protein
VSCVFCVCDFTFILKKLIELEFRKEYEIELSNRFAALEDLNDRDVINKAWVNVKENIKFSAKERLVFY